MTDGDQRAALALVRSLGAAGHEVHVCSTRRRSLAGASRFSRAEAAVPDALRHPAEYVAAIAELLARWRIDALLPVTEPALLALLPERERWPDVCIPFPKLATFQRMANKEAVLEAASAIGIAVPSQHRLTSAHDLSALLNEVEYPVVLKPSRSIGEAGGGRAKVEVAHAANASQLRARVTAYPEAAFPLLVQQRIMGPGVGIFVLLWEDEPVAVFAHRRIREKPPSGGVSVYRESIAADPALAAASITLLRRLEWQGVAMVEFKVEEATGTAYLMEINGRFWGSLQLAIDAGVDFPALLLRACAGEQPDAVTGYRTGVRSRWWWGDVDHLITRMRRSAASLDLPAGERGRLGVIRDFLRVRPGVDRNEVLRMRDPLPFVRESIEWFRNLR